LLKAKVDFSDSYIISVQFQTIQRRRNDHIHSLCAHSHEIKAMSAADMHIAHSHDTVATFVAYMHTALTFSGHIRSNSQ
jgi:SHS2 domain-containing protein